MRANLLPHAKARRQGGVHQFKLFLHPVAEAAKLARLSLKIGRVLHAQLYVRGNGVGQVAEVRLGPVICEGERRELLLGRRGSAKLARCGGWWMILGVKIYRKRQIQNCFDMDLDPLDSHPHYLLTILRRFLRIRVFRTRIRILSRFGSEKSPTWIRSETQVNHFLKSCRN